MIPHSFVLSSSFSYLWYCYVIEHCNHWKQYQINVHPSEMYLNDAKGILFTFSFWGVHHKCKILFDGTFLASEDGDERTIPQTTFSTIHASEILMMASIHHCYISSCSCEEPSIYSLRCSNFSMFNVILMVFQSYVCISERKTTYQTHLNNC